MSSGCNGPRSSRRSVGPPRFEVGQRFLPFAAEGRGRSNCPGLESNQHVQIWTQAPQACASAYSATRAFSQSSLTPRVDASTVVRQPVDLFVEAFFASVLALL